MRPSLAPMLKPLAFALAVLMAGCSHQDDTQTAQTAPAREMTATLAEVRSVDMAVQVPMAGRVIAVESVQLSSRMMGYLRDLKVVEGQAVRKGELLFEIDPVDVQGAVAQAQQGLIQAEAAMRDARADFERFEQLYKDEVVNRQQFEKMRLNHEVARSRVAQARAALAQARGQFDYTRVTAPIDGVVTGKFANEGDMAAPGHPVVALEDSSRLQVQTSVPESIFRHLSLGMAVNVEIDGQPKALTGKVARLSPSADPVAHTYPVKLDVEAPGLRSGIFARVLFTTGTRKALGIPAKAVIQRAGMTGVFVIDAQSLAQYRMVRTGAQVDGMIEILSGVQEGEKVVVVGASQMQNGDKVVTGQAG
ncbi:MAG: efflux RND transporter periplasmic adaptor subunit [Halothiobacillaceae bacterium]|nr:MAG: efflux RND transporter periplasmic adaptor subunit [Halothiobacillaceae bacterium]